MTLCVIQARIGSSRLRGKVLLEIGDRPMIQHVVDRVRQIHGLYAIVVATPAQDRDAINRALRRYGPDEVPDYMASYADLDDADVLGRFAAVLEDYPDADPVMRISGDCPLLDPAICDQVLQLYHQTPGCDYAWNVTPGYVDGTDCEVVSRAALLQAHWCAKDAFDREHVTSWIRRHYPVTTLPASTSVFATPGLKTSVDTLEDLERVRQLWRIR